MLVPFDNLIYSLSLGNSNSRKVKIWKYEGQDGNLLGISKPHPSSQNNTCIPSGSSNGKIATKTMGFTELCDDFDYTNLNLPLIGQFLGQNCRSDMLLNINFSVAFYFCLELFLLSSSNSIQKLFHDKIPWNWFLSSGVSRGECSWSWKMRMCFSGVAGPESTTYHW